ncbi:YciI family protein [Spartinivicinus ruber]|uniref:YciI family protein n=1 Tax=Spartinivicinus ruber TaxID=2683272 RepID=UPI0013D1AE3E|nr:YciI family protein [Spartinivicinus ruber]
MFIVSLTYKVDLAEVDKHLDAHIEYIKKYYENGYFIASGRKKPRSGGVILIKSVEREIVDAIVKEDPFYQADVANFEVIEFEPSMTAKGFEALLSL